MIAYRLVSAATRFRLGDELVADAAHGQQVLRRPRLLLDVAPQPDDEVVDRARVGVFAHAPHVLEHRLARDGLAFVRDQVAQQVGLHQRQRQRALADAQLQRVEVDRLAGEACTGPCAPPHATAERRSRPPTRASRIASSNGLAGSRRRRQQTPCSTSSGRPRAVSISTGTNCSRGAQLGHDGEAVLARQHHVEHDEVEPACR